VSNPLPHRIDLLRSATLADGRVVDVALSEGSVTSVTAAGSIAPSEDAEILDLTGYVLMTAPAEPHAHLDKALSFDLIQPPLGDLDKAILSWREYAAGMTVDDIADRARAAALRMLANGTTAIRSHVDVLQGPEPTRGAEAVVRVRDELAGLIDIEIVALGGWQSPDSAFEAVLDLGVDLIGGAPHLAPDPIADLTRVLAIAERRGVGVDLHTDESLHGAVTLGEFARIVRGWTVPVSAGHCVRLGTLERTELADVIAEVRASNIGIIALPITNLYLQGWDDPVSTPRGLTALRALLDAGVRVAAGADNIRDPFNPVGRADALETASLLVTAGHLDFAESIAAITDGARDVMSLPPAGAETGRAAEFLAVRAGSVGEAIAFAPADRYVIHRGLLVSESHVSVNTASAASALPLGLTAGAGRTVSAGR